MQIFKTSIKKKNERNFWSDVGYLLQPRFPYSRISRKNRKRVASKLYSELSKICMASLTKRKNKKTSLTKYSVEFNDLPHQRVRTKDRIWGC